MAQLYRTSIQSARSARPAPALPSSFRGGGARKPSLALRRGLRRGVSAMDGATEPPGVDSRRPLRNPSAGPTPRILPHTARGSAVGRNPLQRPRRIHQPVLAGHPRQRDVVVDPHLLEQPRLVRVHRLRTHARYLPGAGPGSAATPLPARAATGCRTANRCLPPSTVPDSARCWCPGSGAHLPRHAPRAAVPAHHNPCRYIRPRRLRAAASAAGHLPAPTRSPRGCCGGCARCARSLPCRSHPAGAGHTAPHPAAAGGLHAARLRRSRLRPPPRCRLPPTESSSSRCGPARGHPPGRLESSFTYLFECGHCRSS